jgi:hypothetical protein
MMHDDDNRLTTEEYDRIVSGESDLLLFSDWIEQARGQVATLHGPARAFAAGLLDSLQRDDAERSTDSDHLAVVRCGALRLDASDHLGRLRYVYTLLGATIRSHEQRHEEQRAVGEEYDAKVSRVKDGSIAPGSPANAKTHCRSCVYDRARDANSANAPKTARSNGE